MNLHRYLWAAVAALILSTPALAGPGYLGVYLTDDDRGTKGAVIEDVAPNSPAAQAGVRRGDRVIMFGSTEVKNSAGLIALLTRSEVGQTYGVTILRDGWRKNLKVTLGSLGGEAPAAAPKPTLPQSRERGFLGIYLRQNDAGEPVVDGVLPRSPAQIAGLRKGDLVRKVNDALVTDPAGVIANVSQSGPGDAVRFEVKRRGETLFLTATLSRRPGDATLPKLEKPAKPAPTKPAPKASAGKKPYLGVALADAGGKGPLLVDDVRANAPADRFGLRKGDKILAVNGGAVNTIEDFVKAMQGKAAGEKLTFRVERDGWKHDVPVVLGARD